MPDKLRERKSLFSEIDVYPVISSEFCAGRHPLKVLEGICNGGAKIVQLREKNMPTLEHYELACEFRRICTRTGVLLIINDHLDLALAVEADGVHLGQDDLPLAAARKIAPELILGASTHSREEAELAQAEGADYINIGPIFATGTKSLSTPPLGLEILREILPLLEIPFTVMGGIKRRHICELRSLGASRIAMVTEITEAPDIATRVCEIRKMITGSSRTIC